MEDASSTLADYLTKFHKLKVKRMIPSPRNDFLRYTTVGDFMSVVDEYPDPEENTKEVDKGTAVEYYNDSEIRIVLPQDVEAGCYYGQGTRWCTAAKNNNMFNDYINHGKLYIVIPKHPAHKGEKYQIHFEENQCMNENDESVTIQALVQRFPSLKTALTKEGKQFGIMSLMSDKETAKLAKQGKVYIKTHGVDQGDGVVTVNLNQANSDVEEFYLDSRIANIVNAASSKHDFGFPESGDGASEHSLYVAYAVIDTNMGKDNTWLVWGEVDIYGNGWAQSNQYYGEDDRVPENPKMYECVKGIRKLIAELVEHGGDYDLDDPFEEQRKVLNTLKQKYGE